MDRMLPVAIIAPVTSLYRLDLIITMLQQSLLSGLETRSRWLPEKTLAAPLFAHALCSETYAV